MPFCGIQHGELRSIFENNAKAFNVYCPISSHSGYVALLMLICDDARSSALFVWLHPYTSVSLVACGGLFLAFRPNGVSRPENLPIGHTGKDIPNRHA